MTTKLNGIKINCPELKSGSTIKEEKDFWRQIMAVIETCKSGAVLNYVVFLMLGIDSQTEALKKVPNRLKKNKNLQVLFSDS